VLSGLQIQQGHDQTGTMTASIDEAFAETLADLDKTESCTCRNCGRIYEKARDAHQHSINEHDISKGYKRITEET